MLRHLALAAFSFAVVAIAVFPYWVAVERLEVEREQAQRFEAPLQVSLQCPAAQAHPELATRVELPGQP